MDHDEDEDDQKVFVIHSVESFTSGVRSVIQDVLTNFVESKEPVLEIRHDHRLPVRLGEAASFILLQRSEVGALGLDIEAVLVPGIADKNIKVATVLGGDSDSVDAFGCSGQLDCENLVHCAHVEGTGECDKV